jgi:hypothetical protein
MKKIKFLMLALVFGASAFLATPVLAEHDGGKMCSMCKMNKDAEDCNQCPIASKILKKAKFFLANAKEIGLSDEQVAQIKAIKMETKKTNIRTEAEMKIWKMDLDAKLSEPTVDVEGLNAMMDQTMTGWGTGAKASIATYAKLKAILTEAQMAKAKEIWMRDSDEKQEHGK